MVDAGWVRTTLAEHCGTNSAAILQRAHALLGPGTARGKMVWEGWGKK